MASDHPTLFLVDGSSYLFRAFHALPPLTNARGEPTGALYGVANMIRKWIREHEPEHMAVVFDASGPTFRNELFEDYKANRPPMPDELRSQVEPLLELIEAMGLPLLRVPGVEADDVIGTLSKQATKVGMKTVVSTSDKDLAQLVDEHVTLVNTMSDTIMDVEGVKKKFGVGPDGIIDYLALIGDSSDNIPGVPKVGPKTAAKWLEKYGSLDAIMEHADDFGGKIGQYLRDSLEQLPLSRELTTIRTNVELELGPEDLNRREPDAEKLRELLTRFEFSHWLAELEEGSEVGVAELADYATILEEKELELWLERLTSAERFAFDLETTSLEPMRAEIVGLSFAVASGEAAYVPLAHDYPGVPEQLNREAVLKRFKPLLEDPQRNIVGQHFKYDYIVLRRYGIEVPGWRFDTMLESYVYNSTASRHDMDSLALAYLGRSTIHYEDVAGKGARQISFAEVAIDDAAPYAAEDADVTLQLHEKLWPELEQQEGPSHIFRDIEMPLAPVLARMEMTGVLVDAERLKGMSEDFARRMDALEAEAHEVAGRAFNLGSPKQLQAILFEEQELPVIRKTPKGQPSTAEDVLEQLARDYPLPSIITQHRGLAKLKSTYTDKLPRQINPETGRIHTSYHQAVAATGRLSSTDPNLQNIPIRNEDGRRIRQAFVAPEGCRILAADYSQIELRIMAHLSGDEGLLKAFREGQDIHAATAREVFGDEGRRREAKVINFGLIYGMSAYGLARQLDIERGHAQAYIDQYFERYPGVREYMDSTRERAHEQGYVETVFGRRLYLNEINSRNFQRRQGAERAAINAPMQGTAADIIKRAMIEVDRWLGGELGKSARMIMQVHDELVLEVREDAIDAIRDGITERMEAAAELDVPLEVEVGVGNNWDEAH